MQIKKASALLFAETFIESAPPSGLEPETL